MYLRTKLDNFFFLKFNFVFKWGKKTSTISQNWDTTNNRISCLDPFGKVMPFSQNSNPWIRILSEVCHRLFRQDVPFTMLQCYIHSQCKILSCWDTILKFWCLEPGPTLRIQTTLRLDREVEKQISNGKLWWQQAQVSLEKLTGNSWLVIRKSRKIGRGYLRCVPKTSSSSS